MKLLINLICLFIFDKKKRRAVRKEMLKKHEQALMRKDLNANKIRQVAMKLSLQDDIYMFDDIKIYVPDYPLDYIQKTIVDGNDFYEKDFLTYLDQFINKDMSILEIGANIGNHTVYWGKVRGVKHLYCFEPIKKTFDRLEKNVEINNLKDKVTLFNKGAGAENSKGSIDKYNMENTGATSIKKSEDGDLEIVRIDDIKFDNKIDFVKVDVEGFEIGVIKGMLETLKNNKPVVVIESFEKNAKEIINMMESIGYTSLGDKAHKDNYLFIMTNN